jgi:hypothetical protein
MMGTNEFVTEPILKGVPPEFRDFSDTLTHCYICCPGTQALHASDVSQAQAESFERS